MKWHTPPEPNIPPDLRAWAQNDLLARLLVQRGIRTVDAARAFIHPDEYRPAPPSALPDMTVAVAILHPAIDRKLPILVWGDFDVDGQTSTALLVSVLRRLGADVRFHVPHRLTEGHGIRPENLAAELRTGVKLIITCDTGIDAHDAVDAAHAAGAKIIITDHHDLPETLPPADAVINPKRLPADHPLRELPGVGVAFKLAEAVVQHFKMQNAKFKMQTSETESPERILDSLLDLVALGIVADVARQTGDTRYLLQRGLAVLRRAERLGVRALCEIANLTPETLTAEHIGFWLAPRLNALGRLGDAGQGVTLLLTDDWGEARILAAQLDALNERRKMLVDRTTVQALSLLAGNPRLAAYHAIVLAAKDWHPGVLGLACTRLAEQYRKPVILLTHDGGTLRGSARSVPGCDIHRAIKTQTALLDAFGGHPMAAGLALKPHRLDEFRQGLSDALAACAAQSAAEITIDAPVTVPELNESLLATIEQLAPFGAGNPPVLLGVENITVQKATFIGRARAHRRLTIADDAGHTARVLWWNSAETPVPEGTFDLALTIARDTFRGGDAVQLVWQDMRRRTPPPVRPRREIVDLRQSDAVQELFSDPEALFWSGENLPGVTRLTRPAHQLPAKTLVLWHAPPGHGSLQAMLTESQAERVVLVARPTPLDTAAAFMRHLMGMIKFALAHHGGRLTLADIATAMVHRDATVRLAVDWLVAQGKLRIIVRTDETLVVRADDASPVANAAMLENTLRELLAETAAYRQFFRTAQLTALFPDS